jgi:hypothetical protein
MGRKVWTAAIAGVVFLGLLVFFRGWRYPSSRPEAGPATSSIDERLNRLVEVRLAQADRDAEAKVDAQFRVVDAYFDLAKSKTPIFADEALGWGSKWRLLADWVPFTSGGRNEAFLRRKFEEIVLDPAELEKAIETTIQGYFSEMEAVERRLIVDLQGDIARLAGSGLEGLQAKNISEESFRAALRSVVESSGDKARVEVTRDLVMFIASEVVTAVATRMVVSGSVLAAGGAGGFATLGASVVIGLIVDQLVSWVWDWYADPKGKLSAKINGHLDEMRNLMVQGAEDGERKVVGLRARLLEFARERAGFRGVAVRKMLQEAR